MRSKILNLALRASHIMDLIYLQSLTTYYLYLNKYHTDASNAEPYDVSHTYIYILCPAFFQVLSSV